MPLYEYRCNDCGTSLLRLRAITKRDEVMECPSCERRCERVPTAPSVVKIQGGGTRNHRKIKYWSLKDRLNSQYGDNP